jgi:hypothetical protein
MLLAMSRGARADTAAAQALFADAKKLMAAGKYAEACPKLEESQRLAPGIGTQFNLATCYESLGKTASAWSLYLEVAGASKAANQLDREKVARQAAAALEPKLSRLTITVSKSAPPDIEVKRDGAAVGKAQWGTAIPVDPGEHKIAATAPGKKPWESTITVDKQGTKTVEVPALEAGAGAGPVAGAPPAYYPPTAPPQDNKPKMKRRSGGMMAGGIVALSLGTLATIGGAAGAAICGTTNAADDAFSDPTEDPDRSGGCGPALGVMVGGLVLVGGGITLIVIGGKKVPVEETAKSTLVPAVGIGPGSATLRWTF